MPRRLKKPTSLRAAPTSLVLLLVQFILIKIGTLPIWLFKSLVFGFKYSSKKVSKILNKTQKEIKVKQHNISKTVKKAENIQLPTISVFGRHRGRPRKDWFIPYHLNRAKLYIKRRISLKTKISLGLIVVFILIYLYSFFLLATAYQLPTPEGLSSYSKPTTTEIFDRHGVLLYRMYEGINRSIVNLEELPQHLIDATIAAEDKTFYKHPGIDLLAIARAFYHNVKFDKQEGASTITQQLIKNSLLTPEKTYTRKIKEVILSLWAERIYTKAEILQMYLNNSPYGGPNWGVRAASKTYFDKEPKDLTLAESAYLAGLPASPSQFSPFGTRPDLGIERQKQVLDRMLEEGYINEAEKNEALAEELNFKSSNQAILAPHFVFYVRDILAQKYGERIVSQGGLKILTTLDLGLQGEVEKIVADEVAKLGALNVSNGASMVLDAKTGQILAMNGSLDYFKPGFGNFNATLAQRQPGSSIKPITYATAFKKGYAPGNTILDTPITFQDGVNKYTPVNYDGKFHGPVSLRVALASSLNIPAVKLLQYVGIEEMIQTARDLGITTLEDKNRFGLSLTLGGGEVPMIEMMGAYQAFSQMGTLKKPTGILKISDSEGNTLEEFENKGTQALQPEVAYMINHILSDNKARSMAFGPNSLLNITGQEVGVKTGTSDSKRDNWTFGYSPDFVVGVWVGNNNNAPMNPSLASGVTGAAPIWNRIMRGLLAVKPSTGFVRPSGVIQANIDGRADLAISGVVPKGLVKVRKDDQKTIFTDAFNSYATSSAQAADPNSTTN